MIDGAVRHRRHLPPGKPRQQIELRSAPRDVVQDLVRHARIAAGHREEVFHVVGIEVADAPVTDLARATQRLEPFDRLRERHRAAPVQQIQIEPFGLQPFQALLARGLHTAPAGIVRIDLADEEHVVAHAVQRFAQQRLGRAVAVHFGGIDERHAEFDAFAQRGDLGGTARRLLAHLPRALPQFRNALAVRQADAGDIGRHGGSLCPGFDVRVYPLAAVHTGGQAKARYNATRQ